jgi:hypothetical protein
VITAAVTAALIEQARRRQSASDKQDTSSQLDRIEARLGAIESGLTEDKPS